MDYPVIDIEGTGIRIRELIRESGHTVPEVSEYLGASTSLPFIFNGGTSLLLLLDSPMRLSTDIDIIVEPGTDFEHYIEEASKIIPFKAKDEQEKAVAMAIKDSPYAWAGFKAIGNNKDASDIIALLVPSNVEKLIREYTENPVVHV